MELQEHWADVLRLLGSSRLNLGVNARAQEYNPEDFQIICVGADFIGHGDVVGDGPIKLYLARQNGNHFVPLVRIRQNADRIARLARDSPAQSSSAGSTSVSSPTPAILSRTHLKAALILEAVNCRNKEPEFWLYLLLS